MPLQYACINHIDCTYPCAQRDINVAPCVTDPCNRQAICIPRAKTKRYAYFGGCGVRSCLELRQRPGLLPNSGAFYGFPRRDAIRINLAVAGLFLWRP